MTNQFDWVPFYKELAQKLLKYEHRQQELVSILDEIRRQGYPVTPMLDRDAQGQSFLLTEMEPFTFFGAFNRGLSDQNRTNILQILKEKFDVSAPVPRNFDGIPVLNSTKSWFISFQSLRKPEDVPKLWSLFKVAMGEEPLKNPNFDRVFNEALEVRGAKYNLTMGLFWFRPDVFVGMDGVNREYLGGDSKPPTAESYRQFLKKASEKSIPFYELSYAAHTSRPKGSSNNPVSKPTVMIPEQVNLTEDWAQVSNVTSIAQEKLALWHANLMRKGQIILQGPPGTGKTFVGQHFAKAITGDNGLFEKVQFHPSYSYEDFIQGFRPQSIDGQLVFELRDGIFKQFCQKARSVDAPCVFLIDEINRANLSSVFGELMYLLEYRDQAIQLQNGEAFSIPENVLIIGTMNTADRSIALMDHALRRRFVFLDLEPNYDLLYTHLEGTAVDAEALIQTLQEINNMLGNPHYFLGHAYFLTKPEQLTGNLMAIWQGEIYPYLAEYFFDQPERVQNFTWDRLEKVFYGLESEESINIEKVEAMV